MNEDIESIYKEMLIEKARLLFYDNNRIILYSENPVTIYSESLEDIHWVESYTFYKQYGIFKPL